MTVTSVAHQTDIAIIGAGPHALSLLAHLLHKRQKLRQRFLVFDPSGTWMQQWHQQFAALEIPHLRSPAVHHPDPDPYALRRFAESRPGQLFPPYDLPGTKLFADFCQDVIQRWQLQERVIKAKVVRLEPLQHKHRNYFRLHLQDGESVVARRVILATGSSQPYLPEWVNQIQSPYPPDRLCHSGRVDLRGLHLAGERVLIIGGGLTSGHLAVGAIARQAKVFLMTRRQLQEKLFDAEPGWLGPKYLKGFWNESSWENRWHLVQHARNGGSMTPAMMLQLRRAHNSGQVLLQPECQVVNAQWQDNKWVVNCNDGNQLIVDRIWLATGTKVNVTEQPLLTEILATYPTSIVNGLPVLEQNLRWPGCELYIMGALSALQIGPVARNLFGARMASDRIVPALIKPNVAISSFKVA